MHKGAAWREVKMIQYFRMFPHILHFGASIGVKLPKLDDAGSIPVSRSIFR
jgi:hypothetical protein